VSTIIIITPPPPPPPPEEGDGPLCMVADGRKRRHATASVEFYGEPITAETLGLLIRSLTANHGAGAVRDAARGDSGRDED